MGRMEFFELTEALGALGVSQTQKRIEEEKTGPDGEVWPRTRDDRGALFIDGSHLYRSVQYDADATEATWGTGWIGARVHQYGATIVPKNAKALHFVAGGHDVFTRKATIPARPFVGLSEADEVEMEQVGAQFLERYVR